MDQNSNHKSGGYVYPDDYDRENEVLSKNRFILDHEHPFLVA